MDSRTQGSRPRLRIQKNPRSKTDHPRTDSIEAKYGNAPGQRHNAQVFLKQATTVLCSKNRKFSAKFRCFPKTEKGRKGLYAKNLQIFSTNKTKMFQRVSARSLTCFKTNKQMAITLANFQQIKK